MKLLRRFCTIVCTEFTNLVLLKITVNSTLLERLNTSQPKRHPNPCRVAAKCKLVYGIVVVSEKGATQSCKTIRRVQLYSRSLQSDWIGAAVFFESQPELSDVSHCKGARVSGICAEYYYVFTAETFILFVPYIFCVRSKTWARNKLTRCYLSYLVLFIVFKYIFLII